MTPVFLADEVGAGLVPGSLRVGVGRHGNLRVHYAHMQGVLPIPAAG